jgi:hypothetical protein
MIMRLTTRFLLMLGMGFFGGMFSLRADAVPLDTDALATLAVQDHGRKKPFTTFARETLLTMSGASALPIQNADGTETKLSPEEVMLDLWLKPEGWDEKPVIMLNFLELKKKFGLPEDQKRFSFKELVSQPALLQILDETQKLRQVGKADDLTPLQKEAEHLGERLKLFQDCVNGEKQRVIPNATSIDGPWTPLNLTEMEANPNVDAKGKSASLDVCEITWPDVYRQGDMTKFNALTPKIVESLRALAPQFYPSAASLQFEHHYMTLHPFRWAWIIYLFAIILLLLTALWATTIGYRLTWALALLGLGFEVYGLFCRIIISRR